MIFLNVFLINMFSAAAAEQNPYDGYCNADSKTCNNHLEVTHDYKLLFYDVNPPEGFNLRRDVYMRFAIMLAEASKRGRSDWHLVLPPWYKMYHWRSSDSKSNPLFWSSFFDVNSLKTYAPVLELNDLINKSDYKPIEIDTLYVLQNFDNPFENGVFEEKWQLVESECKYEGNYWGFSIFKAKETVCVRFQGKISKLWELIYQHPSDRKVMFMHAEIPLHDNYGSKSYWDCRKSMKFNKALVNTAKKCINKKFYCESDKCSTYLAIHWRRRDFAYIRPNDVTSVANTVKQVKDAINKYVPNFNKVFIATDADTAELNELKHNLNKIGLNVYIYNPPESDLIEFRAGGIAIIDQIICSHAAYFIGTHDSTFSFRIQEEREIIGFDSNTTFNRFCPDTGVCEKPSQWKIIN